MKAIEATELKDMVTRLRELEGVARILEPNAEQRAAYLAQVRDHTEQFLSQLDHAKAFVSAEDDSRPLLEFTPRENGIGMDLALDLVRRHVDTPGLNPASGGHLGYIPGGGLYLSALGDYLADVTNRYSGVFFAGPGAVRMENMMVRWTADQFGYPETAAGTLLSGGSIANLACIVAARDAHGIRARDIEHSVVYLTEQVHHCVTKAFRIAGMAEAVIRYVPQDEHFRMDPAALATLVQKDRAAGLKPFMVVASCGTTDTGAVDPADAIADVTEAHGLWLHVDAAYGGFFILCEEGRKIIRGLERSDSLVVDPHKAMFLPYGTGIALVREGRYLADAHQYSANYLQDAVLHTAEMSPADLSPELTRHFRGMRMWLPLMVHGEAPFRAGLAEKMWLARYFRERLFEITGMEVGPEPDLSVVLYRYVPETGDANAFNQALIDQIHADGQVFLTSTKIKGTFFLRFACLAHRTHLATVDACLDMLRTCISEVKAEQAAI